MIKKVVLDNNVELKKFYDMLKLAEQQCPQNAGLYEKIRNFEKIHGKVKYYTYDDKSIIQQVRVDF